MPKEKGKNGLVVIMMILQVRSQKGREIPVQNNSLREEQLLLQQLGQILRTLEGLTE